MNPDIEVQPLAHKERKRTFFLLILVFLIAIPFLYMYATGYRFDISRPTTFVSTGGLYVAVAVSDVDLFINDTAVTGARTFRNDFYVQQLDIETHRVHVQKDGYHTWVKELPVSKHLVTEVEAFNIPLVPQVRVISEWVSATGSAITNEPIMFASTTNPIIATSTLITKNFIKNSEFTILHNLFATTSTSTDSTSPVEDIRDLLLGTDEATGTEARDDDTATTTKVVNEVRLYENQGEVYVHWGGPFERMPYYYCADEFDRYSSTSTATTSLKETIDEIEAEIVLAKNPLVVHPVQTISFDDVCDPTIKIDRLGQTVRGFDFLPGSEDFVVLVLDDGVYVVEVDDRSWQNAQLLFSGTELEMLVVRDEVYIYDGTLIYQVYLEINA